MVDEAQPVAVGKAGCSCHVERVSTQFLDCSHKLTHGLRRVKRRDVRLTAICEISGVATVERLLQIWGERIATMSERGAAVAVWILVDELV